MRNITDFLRRNNEASVTATKAFCLWKGYPTTEIRAMGISASIFRRQPITIPPHREFIAGVLAGLKLVLTNGKFPNHGLEDQPPDFKTIANLTRNGEPNKIGQAYGRLVGIIQTKLQYILFDKENRYLKPLMKTIQAFSQEQELFKIQLSAIWWKAMERYTKLQKEAIKRAEDAQRILYQPAQIPVHYRKESK